MKHIPNFKALNKNKLYIAMSNTYSASAFVLYQRLFELQSTYMWITASNSYLSRVCGFSVQTVISILKQFEQDGLIVRDTKMTEANKSKRKIKLVQHIIFPDFDYQESDEIPVEEESIINNVVAELPETKPPKGLTGTRLNNKVTKTKEEKSKLKKLKKAFDELVYKIYPVNKRGDKSKNFTIFKKLSDGDIKLVIKNTKEYINLIDAPYHKSLVKFFNEKQYTDAFIESLKKSDESRNKNNKNESSTALRVDDYTQKFID